MECEVLQSLPMATKDAVIAATDTAMFVLFPICYRLR